MTPRLLRQVQQDLRTGEEDHHQAVGTAPARPLPLRAHADAPLQAVGALGGVRLLLFVASPCPLTLVRIKVQLRSHHKHKEPRGCGQADGIVVLSVCFFFSLSPLPINHQRRALSLPHPGARRRLPVVMVRLRMAETVKKAVEMVEQGRKSVCVHGRELVGV